MKKPSWRPRHYTRWKLHDKTLIENIGAIPDKELAATIGCSLGALKARAKFLDIGHKAGNET